jgi:hypothetical protein
MKNKIRICPKCKSKNLINKITFSAIWGFPSKKKCLDCGFESYLILEKDKKKSKKISKIK